MKYLGYIFTFLLIAIWFYFAWVVPYQEDPDKYKEKFNRATNVMDYERALRILDINIERKANFDHYLFYGKAYFNLMRFDESLENYRKAIELDSNRFEPYLKIARILYQEKENYSEAKEYLLKAKKLDSLNYDLFNEFGTYFEKVNDNDKAYHYFLNAITLDSSNSAAIHNLGVFYLRNELYDSAEKYLLRALKKHGDDFGRAKIYENLGVLFYLQSDLRKSKKYLIKSVDLVSRNENVNLHLGLVNAKQEKNFEAISYFDRAIKYNNKSSQAYFNRALCYYRLENFAESLKDLNSALKIEPKDAKIYALRGNVNFMMKNDLAACRDFKIAAKMGLKEYNEILQKHCK